LFERRDEFGDSLGGGVAIFAGADGVDGAFLKGLGNVKIGLADGEVDGVFELGGEVEDFADAGGVDVEGALGDEGVCVAGVGHGFVSSVYGEPAIVAEGRGGV